MKIALGSDHRGADAVHRLADHLAAGGHDPVLMGRNDGEPADYPDGAHLVARAVAAGEAEFGILICGSGVGMSIAANKVPGVLAALACDETAAEMARRHNNANVLCLSGDRLTAEQLRAFTDAFLAAPFEGGRHERRVKKMFAIEAGRDPASAPESASA
jgi:ribose 5-phosphate isomerase B